MNDTLAIVPARRGSKRVENKNLRDFGAKPLIAHTIEQAHEAEEIDHTIVSTEEDELKRFAEEYGASVPFERPDRLATDEATTSEVTTHAIKWFREHEREFDYVCLLQVTFPFRAVGDIDAAMAKLKQSDAGSLVSVTTYDTPPFWAIEPTENGVEPYFTENLGEDPHTGVSDAVPPERGPSSPPTSLR